MNTFSPAFVRAPLPVPRVIADRVRGGRLGFRGSALRRCPTGIESRMRQCFGHHADGRKRRCGIVRAAGPRRRHLKAHPLRQCRQRALAVDRRGMPVGLFERTVQQWQRAGRTRPTREHVGRFIGAAQHDLGRIVGTSRGRRHRRYGGVEVGTGMHQMHEAQRIRRHGSRGCAPALALAREAVELGQYLLVRVAEQPVRLRVAVDAQPARFDGEEGVGHASAPLGGGVSLAPATARSVRKTQRAPPLAVEADAAAAPRSSTLRKALPST